MVEKHYRSVLKALSWRLTGTMDTIVVSFIVTRHVTTALSIGGIEVCTKILLYYVHERVWNRIKLGRVKPISDYQI
jgi:uncharacterized membrane protein